MEAATRGAAERKATAADAAAAGGAPSLLLPLLSFLLQSSSAEAAIGLRLRRLATGVATRDRSRPATARRPTPPAAPSECPTDDLGEASVRGRGREERALEEEEGEEEAKLARLLAPTIASDAAPSSMGSPRGVPVPCMARATRERAADER